MILNSVQSLIEFNIKKLIIKLLAKKNNKKY